MEDLNQGVCVCESKEGVQGTKMDVDRQRPH